MGVLRNAQLPWQHRQTQAVRQEHHMYFVSIYINSLHCTCIRTDTNYPSRLDDGDDRDYDYHVHEDVTTLIMMILRVTLEISVRRL